MGNKGRGKDNNDNARKEEDEQSSSFLPHISTLYTRRSAKLIRSAEKSASLIVVAIALLLAMSLIDTFEVESASKLLPKDTLDTLISIFSFIALAVTGIMLRSLLKSRHTLEKWADMFEQNAMRSSLSIALNSTSKEEIVRVLPEVIEELGEPLEIYISKGDFNEFFDIQIADGDKLDILIDSQHIIPSKDDVSNLKQLISDYGAIAVRIIDRNIDEKDIVAFSDTLHKYKSKNPENDIGLAILVCSQISPSAEKYAKSSRDFLTRKIILVNISGNQLQEDNQEQSHTG
jgi:hypothetical protein